MFFFFSNLSFKNSSDPPTPLFHPKWGNQISQEIVYKLLFVFFYLKMAGPPFPSSLKIKVEKTLWNCDQIPNIKLWEKICGLVLGKVVTLNHLTNSARNKQITLQIFTSGIILKHTMKYNVIQIYFSSDRGWRSLDHGQIKFTHKNIWNGLRKIHIKLKSTAICAIIRHTDKHLGLITTLLCSLLHSAKPSPQCRQTQGRTLPSALSPCFAKAMLTINIIVEMKFIGL